MRRIAILLLFVLALPVAGQVTPGPGLFGDRRFRAPVASEAALPASGQLGEVRLTLDTLLLYAWDGTVWVAVSGGGGSGEANTASNLGGGLASFSVKVGEDLRFNSFAAADFDLAANLISIDPLKWAELADLPTDTNASTICAGSTTYLDGEGNCDDISSVYAAFVHDHVLSALSGSVTDAQVPNTITVDFATAAGGASPTGVAGGGLGGSYPSPTVDDDGHSHTAATLPVASTTAAGLAEFATDGEVAASVAVQGNDSRMSNARTPTAHAASHQDGGSDEISASALSGQLADAQKVTLRKNSGADVGTRSRVNLIEGANVTLTVADDGAGGEVDVTIAAAGSSGIGGSVGSADNAVPRSDGTGGATLQGSDLRLADVSGNSVTVSTTAGNALVLEATAPAATIGASQAGKPASLKASPAVASTDTAGAATGGDANVTAGDAARLTSGNGDGGDVVLTPGAKIGSGSDGQVLIGRFGTASLPAVGFVGDEDSGFSGAPGGGEINFSTNGNSFWRLTSSGLYSLRPSGGGPSLYGLSGAVNATTAIALQPNYNNTGDGFSTEGAGTATISASDTKILMAQRASSLNRVIVYGGFDLESAAGGSKPSCDSTKRGWLWFTEGGAGVADKTETCCKTASDTYVWSITPGACS